MGGMVPPTTAERAFSPQQIAALDEAFREHIAALKEVDDVLRKMFEDPENRLPPGAHDGPGRRAVETRKKLLALIPPPPMPPVLRHEATPVEAVMLKYRNEMVQLNGGVVFRLKNAAALAGTPREQLLSLAAQLNAGPGSPSPGQPTIPARSP
jgi:hypothetical protein